MCFILTHLHCILSHYTVSYLSYTVRTDPRDVARVESKTYICTEEKRESIPEAKEGIKGKLGNWMSVTDMNKELAARFPGCMKGRNIDYWLDGIINLLSGGLGPFLYISNILEVSNKFHKLYTSNVFCRSTPYYCIIMYNKHPIAFCKHLLVSLFSLSHEYH